MTFDLVDSRNKIKHKYSKVKSFFLAYLINFNNFHFAKLNSSFLNPQTFTSYSTKTIQIKLPSIHSLILT